MQQNTESLIQAGSRVSLYFSLALTSGEIIDSNFESKPCSFRLGDGSMLPGFEAALLGLAPGAQLEQTLPASEAFGEINPQNRQRFPIAKFQHLLEDDLIPTEVGSVVSFKDPAGFDLPGVVWEITDREIGIDFNHPLAGKDIVFKASIVAVLPPATDNVEVKL
jgi:FKBP-type peptidyl-prolyl cis-trans isomerase SlpA